MPLHSIGLQCASLCLTVCLFERFLSPRYRKCLSGALIYSLSINLPAFWFILCKANPNLILHLLIDRPPSMCALFLLKHSFLSLYLISIAPETYATSILPLMVWVAAIFAQTLNLLIHNPKFLPTTLGIVRGKIHRPYLLGRLPFSKDKIDNRRWVGGGPLHEGSRGRRIPEWQPCVGEALVGCIVRNFIVRWNNFLTCIRVA